MLKLIIEKELKSILASPKFPATFGVSAVLILLSVFIGLQEYQSARQQYDAAVQLVNQEMAEATNWMNVDNRVFRAPDPMQIFVSGIHYDIGRVSPIGEWQDVKLKRSSYADDPIFAVFRFIDFTFIVTVVLSLLAILFTYDAINGEREQGTLKLTFANAVPRLQYVTGKFLGSWLGLVVPILIPVLLGLLLVMLYNVPLTGDHWLKIFSLLGISLLYFTFFIAFGLLVSAITRTSASAFLVLLVSWVALTLIIPRAGVMLAGQFVPVPSVAEIESRQAKFEQDRWDQSSQAMETRLAERRNATQGMSDDERQAYEDEHMWDWLQEEDASRKQVQKDIAEYNRKLTESVRNQHTVRERMGFALSRFSPASAFQLAAMNLAGTNIALKTRYEDALHNYRTQFVDFLEKKREETGESGGLRISIDSEKGIDISTGSDIGSLDLSQLPKFAAPSVAFSQIFPSLITDVALLLLFAALTFGGGFVAFLRYDVR